MFGTECLEHVCGMNESEQERALFPLHRGDTDPLCNTNCSRRTWPAKRGPRSRTERRLLLGGPHGRFSLLTPAVLGSWAGILCWVKSGFQPTELGVTKSEMRAPGTLPDRCWMFTGWMDECMRERTNERMNEKESGPPCPHWVNLSWHFTAPPPLPSTPTHRTQGHGERGCFVKRGPITSRGWL